MATSSFTPADRNILRHIAHSEFRQSKRVEQRTRETAERRQKSGQVNGAVASAKRAKEWLKTHAKINSSSISDLCWQPTVIGPAPSSLDMMTLSDNHNDGQETIVPCESGGEDLIIHPSIQHICLFCNQPISPHEPIRYEVFPTAHTVYHVHAHCHANRDV